MVSDHHHHQKTATAPREKNNSAIQQFTKPWRLALFYSSLVNITYRIEIVFWATYKSLNHISQYDAISKWLPWNFDTISGLLMKGLKVISTQQSTAFATSMPAKSVHAAVAMAQAQSTTAWTSPQLPD